jgi:hypothetical protein
VCSYARASIRQLVCLPYLPTRGAVLRWINPRANQRMVHAGQHRVAMRRVMRSKGGDDDVALQALHIIRLRECRTGGKQSRRACRHAVAKGLLQIGMPIQ